MHLHIERGATSPAAKLAVFVVGMITTGVAAEMFYRLIEVPSQWVAKETTFWLTR